MNRVLAIGMLVLLAIALAVGQCYRTAPDVPAATRPGVSIAFRLVANPGDVGGQELPWRAQPGTLRVLDEVVVDETGVESAQLTPSHLGGHSVVLQFGSAAAANLHRVSSAHVGRQMAIIVDGRVLMAPAMRAPMRDNVLIEAGGTSGFSLTEAKDFVDRLVGRTRGE